MAYASRAGRARTSARNPQAFGVCDRCAMWYNHYILRWQMDYAGSGLINKRLLVCRDCYDTPQNQFRSIIVPADPMPIRNPRIEYFGADEGDARLTSGQNTVNQQTGIPVPGGDVRITQNDDIRVLQQTGEAPGGLNQAPGTDPNAPGNDDPGLPLNNDEVPLTGPLNGEAP